MWDDITTTENVEVLFKRLDPTAKVQFKGAVSPASISGLILKCKKGL